MASIKVSRSYKTYEPISMIPATGWRAVYAYKDEGRYAHSKSLVALVLTKVYQTVHGNGEEATGETTTTIVGYAAGEIDVLPAEEAHNFMGYLAPGMRIPDHIEQRAKEYVLTHETTKVTGATNGGK